MQTIYRTNAASPWIKQGDRLTKTFSSGLCLIQQTYVAPKSLATYNAFVEGAAISDSQPCIDGAYIYPAPDYQDTVDGFVRCTVTAYGRWKTEPSVTRQKRRLRLGVDGEIQNMPIDSGVETVNFWEAVFTETPPYAVISRTPLNEVDVFADDLVLHFVSAPNADLPLTPPSSLSRLYKINGEIFPQTIDVSYLLTLFGGQLQWANFAPGGMKILGYSNITQAEFESASIGYNSFLPMESGVSFFLSRCESVQYGHFSEYTASFEVGGSYLTQKPLIFRKK
jgi:hypothetical protein